MDRVSVVGALWMITAAVSIVVAATVAAANSDSREPQRVSIVALISSPRQYDGLRVSVSGYLNLSYESNAVYFHEEDFRYGMTRNAVRVTLEREQAEKFRGLSRK